MLPDFNDDGNLPPGLYRATMEEVEARFGLGSRERRIQFSELVSYVEWARNAAVRRLIINGSFVTAAKSPNDIDVVILPSLQTLSDPRYGHLNDAIWPFLHIYIAFEEEDFQRWAEVDFAQDRKFRRKGVVEILL